MDRTKAEGADIASQAGLLSYAPLAVTLEIVTSI
jgi:hypothetical protein